MTNPQIRLLLALISIIFFGAHAPVHAQSQPELNSAAAASADKADQELTATYQKFRALLKDDAQEQAAFDAAEQAWLAYREKEAEFEASSDFGGSIYPLTVSTAEQKLTEDRIKFLKDMFKNGGP
ncbi:MAG: lysozyme inhibitor LprI family protein [Methylacidiphilales bacterium]|nr:lysozyme inhibitor LprI family protein [Candidatus Methylacidiphilales bacterium]